LLLVYASDAQLPQGPRIGGLGRACLGLNGTSTQYLQTIFFVGSYTRV